MSKHAQQSPVSQHQFWESLYSNGRPNWDMGTPTPVFMELLKSGEIQPGKVCLPGSGLGYDAVLFAQHGCEVTSLEFAPSAVENQRQLASDAGVEMDICTCDIFNLPQRLWGVFDSVVEYVTLCAVEPSRRSEFARIMADLLKPGGRYISLLFPIEDRPGGPPFGLDVQETITDCEAAGLRLMERRIHPATIKPRRGREELLVFQKSN